MNAQPDSAEFATEGERAAWQHGYWFGRHDAGGQTMRVGHHRQPDDPPPIQISLNLSGNEGIEVAPISYQAAETLIAYGHYIGHTRKSGVQIGLFDGGELVGVAIFGQPSREGVAKAMGGDLTTVIELLRFYTRDSHGHMGTRFLSRAVKMLDPTYEVVVAYSDPGAGHHGGLYQAASWLYLGRTTGTPYWYEDADGNRIGKQTPWKAAKRERLAGEAPGGETAAEGERRVAAARGYKRVDGETKYRYAYPRTRAARKRLRAMALPYPKPGLPDG